MGSERSAGASDCAGPGYVFMLPAPDPGCPSHTARGGVDILKTVGRTELESQDSTA